MDHQVKDHARFNNSNLSSSGDVFEPSSSNAKQRATLVEWLNSILPDFNLPINASDEELRGFLVDGTVLCRVLNKLKPGSVPEFNGSANSSHYRTECIERFLSAMDEMGLPRFQAADLEKGSMKIVVEFLLTLQTQFMPNVGRHNGTDTSKRYKPIGEFKGSHEGSPILRSPREDTFRAFSSPASGEERRRVVLSDSKLQRALRTPTMADPSAALINHVGHKFHEVFQLKQGSYTDLPAARISEMMKSNSLDVSLLSRLMTLENAPTQSLLSLVNSILDESIERKNGEIPHRVACLLRKVVQEIERRISTQAEHLRTQNNLFKAREDKYQSRIRVLEALATGTGEETQIVMNQLQHIKSENEKKKMEERKKVEVEEQDTIKDKDDHNKEIEALKQELEIARKAYEQKCLQMETESRGSQQELEERLKELGNLLTESRNKVKLLEASTESKSEWQNTEAEALKQEIEALKQELEITRKTYEQKCLQMQTDSTGSKHELEERLKELGKLLTESRNKVKLLEASTESKSEWQNQEAEALKQEIDALKQELEITRTTYEQKCLQMETDSSGSKHELEKRLMEVANLLAESKNKVKVLEASSNSKSEQWNKKEQNYHKVSVTQLDALRGLRTASQSIQQEISRIQKSYSVEFNQLGTRMKALEEAAKNYYSLLAENRKLHNELQELKGNIRVYCRVRPFLPGQKGKQSIIEHVGENGELVVLNPSKQGKEARRSFKFNKVYGPTAAQVEVFVDTQPLIQSVLDGFNVCIFAYGQTGSGKTYTMTGPDGASEEEWGVNYRALNDLFRISQTRKSTFTYEISVQMMEIYNEQVRDLLSSDSSQKRLGIVSTSQPSGLAVPDASIQPVNRPSDVIELMDIGLKNRARSSTALNERSSRSHSIVTIHTRAVDLKTGSSSRGSLHLVDLAGSERVDRSEVTGDRLKEAQHINKSLAALGDVIAALAQKSTHVPYRNSKLTQVLQSSLGGHAKTLMFVQLNPDATSFSESLSTLKFAERVSAVELGAAKSSKEGRDVRELMEQVASLKDTIAKKDEEIERLQLLKDLKNVPPLSRYGSTSPSKNITGGTPQGSFKKSEVSENAASDEENYSDSDKHSVNNFQKESPGSSNTAGKKIGQNFSVDDEVLGSADAGNEERLSYVSDNFLSMGTETDESSLSPEEADHAENTFRSKSAARIPRPQVKSPRDSPKGQAAMRKSASVTNLLSKPSRIKKMAII